MGLFSSKYETQVSASVSRVITDANLPDAIKTGTLKSLLYGEDQSDHMMEQLINGLALKVNQMYKYAESSYAYGLPSGEIITSNQGQAALQLVLDTLEGASVEMAYNHYGPPNNLHIAWMKLIADYGYDPATNQLSVLTTAEGTPVYLHDMVIRVPEDTVPTMRQGALDQWGTSPKAGQSPTRPTWTADYKWIATHTKVQSPVGSGPEYAVAYWVKEVVGLYYNSLAPTVPEPVTIALTGFDATADYFHAKYLVGEVTKYFMYKVGEGTYPTLDAFFGSAPEMLGEFFPIAHFRYNKVSTTVDKETDEYKTSKKLVKYLGMNFEDVADAIDENPDIGDVEQAMMMLAVPAITSNPLEQRYLYEFFRRLFYTAPETYTSNAMRILKQADLPLKTNMVIQDLRFKYVLSNSGIIRRLVAGTLGPVGSHHSTSSFVSVPYKVSEPAGEGDWVEATYYRKIYSYRYRKQLSTHAYEEIQVVDLAMTYQMDSIYFDVGDGEDKTLLIPLDSIITRAYSMADREKLYARSLHYVFTSRVIIKIKWYEQFWFQAFIAIAGAVIAFATGGATFNAFMATALSGTTALSTVLMTVLSTFIEGLIVSELIQLFVKAVGLEAAVIIGIALAAFGLFDVLRSGGSIKGAPWAADLLKLSSSLTKGVSEVLAEMFQGLKKEALLFNDYMKDVTDDINVAQKLLESSNHLTPLVMWGETPQEYFKRTIHTGNIGIIGVTGVSSYVTNSLKLPTLQQSLGDDDYGI